jgi:hypothetical protein
MSAATDWRQGGTVILLCTMHQNSNRLHKLIQAETRNISSGRLLRNYVKQKLSLELSVLVFLQHSYPIGFNILPLLEAKKPMPENK